MHKHIEAENVSFIHPRTECFFWKLSGKKKKKRKRKAFVWIQIWLSLSQFHW